MYVIVVGGGKVGYYLTKQLMAEGHEVLLMEKDRRRQAMLAEGLGEIVVQGDGCEVRVMTEAGFGRADVVVAVTGDDEDNLVICQMAKNKFTAPRTVARVNDPANLSLFRRWALTPRFPARRSSSICWNSRSSRARSSPSARCGTATSRSSPSTSRSVHRCWAAPSATCGCRATP